MEDGKKLAIFIFIVVINIIITAVNIGYYNESKNRICDSDNYYLYETVENSVTFEEILLVSNRYDHTTFGFTLTENDFEMYFNDFGDLNKSYSVIIDLEKNITKVMIVDYGCTNDYGGYCIDSYAGNLNQTR